MSSTELGPEIPGYQLGPLLGRGGMGQVYRAWDETRQRDVAVKLLTVDDEEKQFRERFQREASILEGLSHPNIVQLHEWGRTEEDNYLVMELVEGETLSAKRPISVDRAIEIGLALCDALIHAHDRGIVHRDIKPSNVLIADTGVVKLADFGIARPIQTASGHTLTSTNAMVGTPFFTAPEAALGAPPSKQLDVYSMGVLLYNAVTSEYPVGDYERLPEPFDRIVRRALAYKPERRYPDMRAMRADLAAAKSGQALAPSKSQAMTAVEGPVPTPSKEPDRAARRWPLALVLVIPIVSVILVWQAMSSGTETESARPDAQSTNPLATVPTIHVDATPIAPSPSAPKEDAGPPDARAKEERVTSRPVREPVRATATGTLVIHARPWAEVEIDGKAGARAEPPLGGMYSLSTGTHRLRLTNPLNGKSQSRSVSIETDKRKVIRVDLRSAP